jgi:excisionase family DNA binding protein
LSTIDWLTVADIARDLGVKEDTVRSWIREKKLTAYFIGREWKVKPEDLQRFLQERKNTREG